MGGFSAGKIGWLLFHNGMHRLHVRLAPEGPLARKHLVENGPEVKEVGAVIYRLTLAPVRAPCSPSSPAPALKEFLLAFRCYLSGCHHSEAESAWPGQSPES